MRRRKIVLTILFPIILAVFALQDCGEGYSNIELPKLKLSIEADESAQIISNTSHEAVIRGTSGVFLKIIRLDRTRIDDDSIGRLVVSTALSQGLELSSLEGRRMVGGNITGSYVIGTKGDSVIVVGGFIGNRSTDGYISVFHYPKEIADKAKYSMESMKYTE
ncbi:hypothetical protein [Bacteroides heparinolyticus]|uniref:hypothetical protein n=1 Tax=Prevotella heparinolytica TaxID=28113 RepID=UPI00359FFCDA